MGKWVQKRRYGEGIGGSQPLEQKKKKYCFMQSMPQILLLFY